MDDKTLVIERIFDAPRELVWEAWTNPDMNTKWTAPPDCAGTFSELDVRVGGHYRAGMRASTGEEYIEHGVYKEIVEPERLVFTHSWEKNDHEPQVETLVTVLLEEKDEKTIMTFRQVGFATKKSRDSHQEGWSGSFDVLSRIIKQIGESNEKGGE